MAREKAEGKTVLRMHRATDVLSTLHNAALVVNSMTFEQNTAVSPCDRASRRGGGEEEDDSPLYLSAVLLLPRPFYCLGLALGHI